MNQPVEAPGQNVDLLTADNLWANVENFALVAALGAALILLPLIVWRWRESRFLPLQRYRWVHWQGMEVTLAILTMVVLPLVVPVLLRETGFFEMVYGETPVSIRQALWSCPLVLLVNLALIFTTLYQLSQTRPSEIGLGIVRWPQNVILGYLGYLVLAPVVLAIYFLLQLIIPPRAHDLFQLGTMSLSTVEWGLLFFQTLVAAPMLEEIICRGLLQAWLRKASLSGHWAVLSFVLAFGSLGSVQTDDQGQTFQVDYVMLGFTFLLVVGYFHLLNQRRQRGLFQMADDYARPLPAEFSSNGRHEGEFPDELPNDAVSAWLQQDALQQRSKAWLSIVGSTMVWSIFHIQAWPAPMPLFVFGLGLGWLAHRTQSLIPGIIVHSLFNAIATLVLYGMAP